MNTTTQRMFGSDLPPSQRHKAVREDIETRQKRARSLAEAQNRANRIAEKQREKQREEALSILEEGCDPLDVEFYVAISLGFESLEAYQRDRDHKFNLAVEREQRAAMSKAYKDVEQRFEAERQALINKYSKKSKGKRK